MLNHIKTIENFLQELNDIYHCKIDLKKKHSIKKEKEDFSNIKFSQNCLIFIKNSLPYTIANLHDNNLFIFLNENFKPIGIYGNEFINYAYFKQLAFQYPKDISFIYFFHKFNQPYLSRKYFIEYLIRLKFFLIDYKNSNIILKPKNYYSEIFKG